MFGVRPNISSGKVKKKTTDRLQRRGRREAKYMRNLLYFNLQRDWKTGLQHTSICRWLTSVNNRRASQRHRCTHISHNMPSALDSPTIHFRTKSTAESTQATTGRTVQGKKNPPKLRTGRSREVGGGRKTKRMSLFTRWPVGQFAKRAVC